MRKTGARFSLVCEALLWLFLLPLLLPVRIGLVTESAIALLTLACLEWRRRKGNHPSLLVAPFLTLRNLLLLCGSCSLCFSEEGLCKGGRCFSEKESHPKTLKVLVSFSMPDRTWLALSKDIEKYGGLFVVRGFPENRAEAFLARVLQLKRMGVASGIEVDPEAFDRYDVRSVPTFVLETDAGYEKVTGHVTAAYAMRKLGEER
ncbi:MAG: type-F conjugative transfer system pilin assembly protein TrbC [Simkaniaceae bacterium]|nr:type-F conjugative transfer system pilin assembly protein TrbC [Simkaniaceae bacterium]